MKITEKDIRIAMGLINIYGKVSNSLLQRKMKVTHQMAKTIIETIEERQGEKNVRVASNVERVP